MSEPRFAPIELDPTAFMSGQVGSKLWLCEKLEPILLQHFDRHVTVWLLGGWYGMTNFLLQTRRIAPIAHTTSFDIDIDAVEGAKVLNETFIYQGTFSAEAADAHTLSYEGDLPPDVVINTSTEHMRGRAWFDRIPSGTLCALQSNDMPHDDHHESFSSTDEFATAYPLANTMFRGHKSFHYPTWSFNRFMIIGEK